MFCGQILTFCFLCFCAAEWIKLPEINVGLILSEDQKNAHIPFVKVSIEKNENNLYRNASLSNTSMFTEDFSHSLTTQMTTLIDNVMNKSNKLTIALENSKKVIDKSDEVDLKNSKEDTQKTKTKNVQIEKEIIGEDVDKNGESRIQSDPSVFKIPDFINIIKNIQNHLFANIPNALKGKLEYLKIIHDNILINIDRQIRILWPRNGRHKRGTKGDVDFPSSETALMTISFLTFAVFLIKLVMQLINVLKAKKMMTYTPMVTGREASQLDLGFKTGISNEDTARILQLMENFNDN